MAIKLNGSTSGSVALDAPADTSPSGTDVTLTLPTSAGSSGQYLQTDGSGTLSWQTVTDTGTQWTDGTRQTLSGTDITFSSIPSNVILIQITILEMSFNGASDLRIRLGDSGGEESTGYMGRAYATTSVKQMTTDAFGFEYTNAASYIYSGQIRIFNHDSNDWFSEGRVFQENANDYMGYTGRKTLSDQLTQVRLFASGGHSFDSGSVTLHYLTSS